MKQFTLNRHYALISLYIFGVIAISFIFGLAVFNLADIFALVGDAVDAVKAIPYGIVLALVLYPFVNVTGALYSRILERKRPHPRAVGILSMLTVYIGMFLVIAILLLGIIPPMIGTVTELFSLVSQSYTAWESALLAAVAPSEFFTQMAIEALEMLQGTVKSILGADVAGTVTGLLTTTVGETFNILVGLIISIYLLAGRRMLSSIFGRLAAAILPAGGSHRFSMFIKRLYSNLTEFISSRILSALFLGITSYLLFWAFGIPFFALLALIIVVCNLFPVFGTIFSFLFCGLVIAITKPEYILPVLGILVALELLDNLIIEPHTMPHKDLRPNVGATMVLLLCGFAIAGLVGAICALPVYATVRNALRAFSVRLLARRRLPTAIEDYQSFDMREHMKAREAADAAVAEAEDANPDSDIPADGGVADGDFGEGEK